MRASNFTFEHRFLAPGVGDYLDLPLLLSRDAFEKISAGRLLTRCRRQAQMEDVSVNFVEKNRCLPRSGLDPDRDGMGHVELRRRSVLGSVCG